MQIRLLCRELLSKSELLIHPRLPPTPVKFNFPAKEGAPAFPLKMHIDSQSPLKAQSMCNTGLTQDHTNAIIAATSTQSKALVAEHMEQLNTLQLQNESKEEQIVSLTALKPKVSSRFSSSEIAGNLEISESKPQNQLDYVNSSIPQSIYKGENLEHDQIIGLAATSEDNDRDFTDRSDPVGDSDVDMDFPEIQIDSDEEEDVE